MKKLLYLFIVFTIVSCSKDDENESQTFFEKYNEIVWIRNDSSPDDSFYIAVYDQPKAIYYWGIYSGLEYCDPVIFNSGQTTGSNDSVWTIEENTINNLVVGVTYATFGEESNIRLAVNNDETILTQTVNIIGTGEIETLTYSRSNDSNTCL